MSRFERQRDRIDGASNGLPAKDREKKPTLFLGCGEIGQVKRNCPKEIAEKDSKSPTEIKEKIQSRRHATTAERKDTWHDSVALR